jgi:hypothetical protein
LDGYEKAVFLHPFWAMQRSQNVEEVNIAWKMVSVDVLRKLGLGNLSIGKSTATGFDSISILSSSTRCRSKRATGWLPAPCLWSQSTASAKEAGAPAATSRQRVVDRSQAGNLRATHASVATLWGGSGIKMSCEVRAVCSGQILYIVQPEE